MLIIELPKNFKKEKIFYDFIQREKKFVMYSLRYPDSDKKIVGYDIFKIRNDFICNKERMPFNSAWGEKAWSYTTLKSAQEKFKELTK